MGKSTQHIQNCGEIVETTVIFPQAYQQQQQQADPIKQLVGGLQHQQRGAISPHMGGPVPPHVTAPSPALRPEVQNLLQRKWMV